MTAEIGWHWAQLRCKRSSEYEGVRRDENHETLLNRARTYAYILQLTTNLISSMQVYNTQRSANARPSQHTDALTATND